MKQKAIKRFILLIPLFDDRKTHFVSVLDIKGILGAG